MLPCCPALTLRGLLSTRDNVLELNRVFSPDHFSLILISLPLTFCVSVSVCTSLFMFVCHSSQLSLPPLLFFYPDFPFFLSTRSSPHPVITTGAVPLPASARARSHQAFLMLLRSEAAAVVSSFPLSPLWLCLLLLSPGVVSLPSGPL